MKWSHCWHMSKSGYYSIIIGEVLSLNTSINTLFKSHLSKITEGSFFSSLKPCYIHYLVQQSVSIRIGGYGLRKYSGGSTQEKCGFNILNDTHGKTCIARALKREVSQSREWVSSEFKMFANALTGYSVVRASEFRLKNPGLDS